MYATEERGSSTTLPRPGLGGGYQYICRKEVEKKCLEIGTACGEHTAGPDHETTVLCWVASMIAAPRKPKCRHYGSWKRRTSSLAGFCKSDRLLMLMVKGASGSWYSSSPENGVDVISVSSLDKYVSFQVLPLSFFLSSQLQLQKHRHSFTKTQHQRHRTRLYHPLWHLSIAYAWRLAYLCYGQGYDHR